MLLTIRSSHSVSANRSRLARRAAFTLLEVLIVVAILVILAGSASIALFKYLDDAKVGRAKNDMAAIETAINTYYLQHNEWPDPNSLPMTVGPLLSQGADGLRDPWGGQYTYQPKEIAQPDGSSIQRPMVICQPPGKQPIYWPER